MDTNPVGLDVISVNRFRPVNWKEGLRVVVLHPVPYDERTLVRFAGEIARDHGYDPDGEVKAGKPQRSACGKAMTVVWFSTVAGTKAREPVSW